MKPNNYIMGIVVVLIIIIALGIIGYVVGYDFSSILAILSMLISIVAICATFIQNKHLSA